MLLHKCLDGSQVDLEGAVVYLIPQGMRGTAGMSCLITSVILVWSLLALGGVLVLACLVGRNTHPIAGSFLCVASKQFHLQSFVLNTVCEYCKSRQKQAKSLLLFSRMASNVTACLSPTRGNCCWLLKILSSSWITFLSKSAVYPYPDLHSCIRSAQPHC